MTHATASSHALFRGFLVAALLSTVTTTASAQNGGQRRSNGKGFRVSVGAAAIAISPNVGATSAGIGPTFTAAWGFGDRLSAFFGFDVAYDIHMMGQTSVYGRFDILGLRYTLAKRTRSTIPFIELMYAESSFGRSQDSVYASDTQWNGRIGIEHFFSLGQAIEVSVGPGSGTLDNHDPILGDPATVSQRFTSWHARVQMNWRPWSRRRRD